MAAMIRCAFSLSSLRSPCCGWGEASIGATLVGRPASANPPHLGRAGSLAARMTRPVVQLVATGGTIAMTGSPARPALSGADLVGAIPKLEEIAELRAGQLSNVPGVTLDPPAMARAVAAASAAVAAGAVGAVITQGTDTIEETA